MEAFKDLEIVFKYLKKYKKKAYFIALISLIGSLIPAVIPFIYGRLVDAAILETASLKYIGTFLLIWLILALIGNWAGRFGRTKGWKLSADVGNDFLLQGAGHLLEVPLRFHKREKMGKIVRRVSRGANFLETIIGEIVFGIAPAFLTVFGALIILARIKWQLALALLTVLILYSLASFWKTKPIIKAQEGLNKAYEEAYGNLHDSISNIETVKAFTGEEFEKQKVERNFRERAGKKFKDFMELWDDLSLWQQTIFSLGFIFVFGQALFFLRKNLISAGQLVMFLGYVQLAYHPFGRLAQYYRITSIGLVTIHRALNLLKIEPELYEPKGAKELKAPKGEVEFLNVTFSYQNHQRILDDISFKVRSGEVIALVGKSGVGKTTLVDLISRYYTSEKGKILIDGQDISKVTLKSLRKNIARVPQEIILFNDTIKNNIRYGKLAASDKEIIRAAKKAQAHEFIKKFPRKYDQLVGERGIKLSTGEKQRIAIARAILKGAKILILDEAMASLDMETERKIRKALKQLMKGKTTLIIAHRLSTVIGADRIFVLEKEKIVEKGTHKELLEKGKVYKELYKSQIF